VYLLLGYLRKFAINRSQEIVFDPSSRID